MHHWMNIPNQFVFCYGKYKYFKAITFCNLFLQLVGFIYLVFKISKYFLLNKQILTSRNDILSKQLLIFVKGIWCFWRVPYGILLEICCELLNLFFYDQSIDIIQVRFFQNFKGLPQGKVVWATKNECQSFVLSLQVF